MTAEFISNGTPAANKGKHGHPHEPATNLVRLDPKEGAENLVRDINVKIADIENQLMLMSLDVGGAQKDLRETLGLLEQTQQETATNLAELSAGFRISSKQQKNLNAALEEHFARIFQQLDERLNNTNRVIDSQRERIDLLDSGHAELVRLQENLAQLAAQQSRQLQHVEELASQGITGNRLEIVALNDKHRHQLQSLQLLSEDQEATRAYTEKLNSYLLELDTNLAAQTRKQKKRAGQIVGLVAAVAIVTMATVTYLELNPSRIPAPVSAQLNDLEMSVASLNSDVLAAQSVVASNRSDLLALAENLQADLAQTTTQLQAGLDGQAQKAASELQQLNSKFEDLQYRLQGPGTLAQVSAVPLLPLLDKNWLFSQDPDQYSIQLVGFFRQQQLLNYINLNAESLAGKPLFFTQVKHGNRDWYNLYTGTYANLDGAETALDTLPLRLRNSNPYVRSLGNIQSSVTP